MKLFEKLIHDMLFMGIMCYTRDWSVVIPITHTKFKVQPQHVRELRTDLEERLQDFVYGFTSGDTDTGFKNVPCLVQTTAPSTAANQVLLHGSDLNSLTELWVAHESGQRSPLTIGGLLGLLNNTNLVALDSTGTGTINLIKGNAENIPELPQGTVLSGTTAPTTDLQIPGKKYVDDVMGTLNERILVGEGTAAHGATISYPTIPSGRASGDYTWYVMVSVNSINTSASAGAINKIECSVSSRVVTCRGNRTNWVNGGTNVWVNGTANYIIIGILD